MIEPFCIHTLTDSYPPPKKTLDEVPFKFYYLYSRKVGSQAIFNRILDIQKVMCTLGDTRKCQKFTP